jgi:hypothetical protein
VLDNDISIDVKDQSGTPFTSQANVAFTVSDHDSAGHRLASGSITLNSNSFFFTGTVDGRSISDLLTNKVRERNGLGDLSVDQIKELAILHELMHLNDTTGKYDDLNNPSNTLNNLIRSACF